MAIAVSPSKLSLPQVNPGVKTVLEFLVHKFPSINRDVWQQRMSDGKVHWHDGSLISADSLYAAQQRVYYYREVKQEPRIPFTEKVIFQDQSIIVAFKPHFLPVTPGGQHVEECLQNRLRSRYANQQIQAVHRIDKATAGLVLFSLNSSSRKHYHRLFETHKVNKTYQAIASTTHKPVKEKQQWEIKNRIEKSEPKFLMRISEGEANSHSHIRCVKTSEDKALFELKPVTGKTHQLRLHMQSLGWPILNDSYYPDLLPSHEGEFTHALQLLAQKLEFIDPITQTARSFSSNTELSLN
jgi:tRNA pseudouridine32 synthase/23S rRNA pseudouridine746 synthase